MQRLVILIVVCSILGAFSKTLQQNKENFICCSKRLRCCKSEPSIFEVKAVLTKPDDNRHTLTNNIESKSFEETYENCNEQKLHLTIKVSNEGVISNNSQYIIIDHINDPLTKQKVTLLNPFVIKLKQELLESYGLIFDHVVNYEAKEIIDNEGCNGKSNKCQPIKYSGRKVPYSEGFCCMCNINKDQERNTFRDALKDQCPKKPVYGNNIRMDNDGNNYKHYGFIGPTPFRYRPGEEVYGPTSKDADVPPSYQQFTGQNINTPKLPGYFLPKKRISRSAQNCFKNLPESQHCLDFSKNWYQVFSLSKPKIVHVLYLEIFQKFDNQNGRIVWKDVTKGNVIKIANDNASYVDDHIAVKYHSKCDEDDVTLDYKNFKLLMPDRESQEINFGPEEYLYVPKELISYNGKDCDSAGIGYEAFYKQPRRCSQSPGSCLGNQPRHLRLHDLQAQKSGQMGRYFLKNFALLPPFPIKYSTNRTEESVSVLHLQPQTSILNIEIKTDVVALLQSNFATITEVFIDGTNPQFATITAKITNSGLMATIFYLRLSGCSLNVPAIFNNIATRSVLIPPQTQHIFHIDIDCVVPADNFQCSLDVFNIDQQILASRIIEYQKFDRCLCMWHCACTCYVRDAGLKCQSLPLENYHLAGFQGGLPVTAKILRVSYFDYLLSVFFHILLLSVIILLLMGLMKALIGFFISPTIGAWGIDSIFGANKPPPPFCDNRTCPVTNESSRISRGGQFCLNLLFFLIYPLALINNGIKKMCAIKCTNEKVIKTVDYLAPSEDNNKNTKFDKWKKKCTHRFGCNKFKERSDFR